MLQIYHICDQSDNHFVMVRSFDDLYPTRVQYKHKQNLVETLSRVPCKRRLSTCSLLIGRKIPCSGTYLVSQNVQAGLCCMSVLELAIATNIDIDIFFILDFRLGFCLITKTHAFHISVYIE